MSAVNSFSFNLSEKRATKKRDAKKKNQCQIDKNNIILYIENDFNQEDIENGYQEMAQINLEFSQLSCAYDLNECSEYESWLAESDTSNDTIYSKTRRYLLCRP